jgi:hypothetical protein
VNDTGWDKGTFQINDSVLFLNPGNGYVNYAVKSLKNLIDSTSVRCIYTIALIPAKGTGPSSSSRC